MQELILYSTLGCHLCELALDEIEPCIKNTNITIKEVDIADDPQLLEQYGTSIPVAYIKQSDVRLYWPFDREQVAVFLKDANIL
jgi:hypothetical protein